MNATPPPDSKVGSGIPANAAPSSQTSDRASTNSPHFLRKLASSGRFPIVIAAMLLMLVGLRVALLQRNLAWRKNVRMDNVFLGNPADVVNGVVEWGSYAVHTRRGAALLDIDLEKPKAIGLVRIYGRGDAYHMDSKAPIVVQHSVDGQTYVNAGQCGLVLTQVAPCKVELENITARYVRLSHPTHLVLSEVEVFPAQ